MGGSDSCVGATVAVMEMEEKGGIGIHVWGLQDLVLTPSKKETGEEPGAFQSGETAVGCGDRKDQVGVGPERESFVLQILLICKIC